MCEYHVSVVRGRIEMLEPIPVIARTGSSCERRKVIKKQEKCALQLMGSPDGCTVESGSLCWCGRMEQSLLRKYISILDIRHFGEKSIGLRST